MKIILSAFNGKMISDPMDIPEGCGNQWKMAMVQHIQFYNTHGREYPMMSQPLNKILTFEWNGKINVYGKENTICREYVLIDIN